eukprot:2719170-Amphidinium_carterae.1
MLMRQWPAITTTPLALRQTGTCSQSDANLSAEMTGVAMLNVPKQVKASASLVTYAAAGVSSNLAMDVYDF